MTIILPVEKPLLGGFQDSGYEYNFSSRIHFWNLANKRILVLELLMKIKTSHKFRTVPADEIVPSNPIFGSTLKKSLSSYIKINLIATSVNLCLPFNCFQIIGKYHSQVDNIFPTTIELSEKM